MGKGNKKEVMTKISKCKKLARSPASTFQTPSAKESPLQEAQDESTGRAKAKGRRDGPKKGTNISHAKLKRLSNSKTEERKILPQIKPMRVCNMLGVVSEGKQNIRELFWKARSSTPTTMEEERGNILCRKHPQKNN